MSLRSTPPDLSADFVRALDLHKKRIRRLQWALCECRQRGFFQADLHDETCPVYVIADEQKTALAKLAEKP